MMSHTKPHVQVGFANPYMQCESCSHRVVYWHDSERCGCDEDYFNYPCGHNADAVSLCSTWNPVDGCSCETLCAW